MQAPQDGLSFAYRFRLNIDWDPEQLPKAKSAAGFGPQAQNR
ncbi:MAG: hypothetical protein Alpg2KO_33820 [Alphaproteobacteria bacterium]